MSARPGGPPVDEITRAGLPGFVQAWSKALSGTVYVPLTPRERQLLLTRLASRLRDAMTRDRFDPQAPRQVGAELVAAGFAAPEVIGRTVTVVTTRLASDFDLGMYDPAAGQAAADRLTALVESLIDGFTAALRDRSLDAQEEVRAAAMRAQARAEQALRESEAKFQHFATHDPVTGLPNRALFTQWLGNRAAAAASGRRVAVCCLDLDRFAAVNDSLGFPAGDRLLIAVADRLRALAAASNWQVARFEGDQFALLIDDTTGSEDATKAADRALSVLAEPFQIDDVELPIAASAGVAERPLATGTEAAEVIKAAQTALHWAKADGRAQWRLFRQARADTDADRYRLSAAIPSGLRRGEFRVDYQPLVSLASGRPVGAEALARWLHPEHGLLPAHRFISLAEDTGLIVALGNQLLAQACEQAAQWPPGTAGAPYISVNVSAAQLHQAGFVGYVAQVLDRAGLPPQRLQVEVTEDAIIDTDNAYEALEALVNLGVRIAVDDFGTGYSNLARLRGLPLHTLKLDAVFARRPLPPAVPEAGGHDEFLATVVAFGHTLGLTVTAEGIETAAHADRMRAAGCDTGQGWHFGCPQPAHEIASVLG